MTGTARSRARLLEGFWRAWRNISTECESLFNKSKEWANSDSDRMCSPGGKGVLGVSTGLTSWDTAANVHGCHPSPDLGGCLVDDVTLFDGALACASRGSGVVVDDDTNTGSLSASSELDLGSLDESSLGVEECAIEAGEVSLRLRGVSVFAGGDFLAQALKSRDLPGLIGSKRELSVGVLAPARGKCYGTHLLRQSRVRRANGDGLGLTLSSSGGRVDRGGIGSRSSSLRACSACGGVNRRTFQSVHQVRHVLPTSEADFTITCWPRVSVMHSSTRDT